MKSKQDATGRNLDTLKKRVKILEMKVRNQAADIHHIYTGLKRMLRVSS